MDFLLLNEEVTLVLTLSMCGVWKPKFAFSLLPVGLEKIDILEAKLRDAQEEIAMLKRGGNDAYLSVSSTTPCGNQQMVTWNAEKPKEINAKYFKMSDNHQEVTILKQGIYMVQVRLAGVNTRNGQHLGLQKNGADIARCYECDASDYQNTAQIYDILRLDANDVLCVRCGANQNSLADPLANRWTILKL